jgi:hypothetical protein
MKRIVLLALMAVWLVLPFVEQVWKLPFAWASATATATLTATPTSIATPAAVTDAACACVTINDAANGILAANDRGSYGRRWLCLQNVDQTDPGDYVACNIGNQTPITISTGIILPAQTTTLRVPPYCVQPVQQPSKTYKMVPNGQVNCIAAPGTTATVCACDG